MAEQVFVEPTPIPDPVLEIEFTMGVGQYGHKAGHKIMIHESTLRRIFEIQKEVNGPMTAPMSAETRHIDE